MKDKNRKDKRIEEFLKDTVKDLTVTHQASIVIEVRRGSPDYKVLTAILGVCGRDILNNASTFCVEARPGPKSLHEFLFKPKAHSAFFKWLLFFSGMEGFKESAVAEGMTADLVFHMYGYICWGKGRVLQ